MDSFIATKAMIRFLIVIVGFSPGILMIMYPAVEAGLRINTAPATVNPLILILINLIGFSGMAGKKVPVHRLALVTAGALLIVMGTIC